MKRSITPPKVTGFDDDILEELLFTVDDKYTCYCYCMDYEETDEYCLRITNDKGEELYSVWFDSSLCWTSGNDEFYTTENIQPIVDKAFKVIKEYIIQF